ncbi:hypothetical protein AG1IA_01310 [Rhizoctonia solani AG-1 IA]|uniref:CCZ1/INTU/HSP4 first Longin domain-containing protein n=1 Tax=Thanatephorus cucumeris (strain AG1-IA) TaxID=983506 RepID=L8X7P8_THACA|nr:hypothetical protein AG1IA_01310 [Rhizoctonia solani AG-1 IA]
MSRIPPALAYLVIYNPTLQPNPEELTDDRDEDDVAEQAHVLFYTARERAVSRDRILRQVGLAKALANFADGDQSAEFDYHSNSLNDEVLPDGVHFLERRLESYFTPWAWQWNVGATPEFGSYLVGLSIHPLKKQFATSITDYAQHVPNVPTLVLAPPHIITGSGLPSISPLLPLARLLEPLVPPPVPSPQPSPTVSAPITTSAHLNVLATSGKVVTKYITKPAAQVVDPRNWSWPALPFGKGSVRDKGRDRGKPPTSITVETGKKSTEPSNESVASFEPNSSKDHLGLPTDEALSRVSRSVSPSTIDHESLLDAQLDRITSNKTDTPVDPAFIPLPIGSDSDLVTSVDDLSEDNQSAGRGPAASDMPFESTLFTDSTMASDRVNASNIETEETTKSQLTNDEQVYPSSEPTSESLQATPIALARVGLPSEDIAPAPSTVTPTTAQVQFSTRTKIETISGSVNVWLDSSGERVGSDATQKQRVAWIAVSHALWPSLMLLTRLKIPGILIASVIAEEDNSVWENAAQQLLLAVHEVIQKRRLTAAETTLRALNTTKVVAHYPAAQLSGSSSLPQFTSESPQLFTSARALQFATSPAIREIVTQTRWGTWCAARQSTIKTRVYIEVDRKDANLVEVDHELGSACRRWEESDA